MKQACLAMMFVASALFGACNEGNGIHTDTTLEDLSAEDAGGDSGGDLGSSPDTGEDTSSPDAAMDLLDPDELELPDLLDPDMVTPPCVVDEDCDDEDWCTTDSCIDGLCYNQAKDCGDDNECTVDACDPESGLCTYEDVDCDDGNDCTVESCKPATGCEFTELEDCCPAEVVVEWGMEEDIEGLDIVNLGPEVSDDVAWTFSDLKPYSGVTSLYFGNPDAGNYDSGARVRGAATFPPAVIPGGIDVELRFFAWIDVEAPVYADVFTVYIVRDNGIRVPALTKTEQAAFGEWEEWVVYLNAFAGETVRIELYFDSFNAAENGGEGIFVDDLRIAGRCPLPETCIAVVDCNDMNPCTADSCDEGTCVYEINEACCIYLAQCDDDDPCTLEECIDGTCQYVVTPNCCDVDGDCDDGDPCTTGKCTEGICFHVPSGAAGCCQLDLDCDDLEPCTDDSCVEGACVNVNHCCYGDDECDDGDDVCTLDSCINGDCVYEPTGEAGCCFEAILGEDFEGALAGWTISPMNEGNVGWQTWSGAPDGDGQVLYYGNILNESFDNGEINTGEVISPELWLQPDTDNTLGFDLYMATESGLSYDMFQIFVDWTGNDSWVLIWDKSDLVGMGAWGTYSLDLSGLAGETVRLRFWFDSADSMNNDGLGVLLDNLSATSTCQPKTCAADMDCSDDVPGTIGACSDTGICEYQISDEPCQEALDCDDQDACTIDTCEIAFCEHTPAEDCCYELADCDDDNVCTEDACDLEHSPAPQCTHDWAPGCCLDEPDCDDANPCTEDICPGEGGQCENPPIPGCCLADADCDDDDDCTDDDCANNVCVNQYYCCATNDDCDDGDDDCTDDVCVEGFCQFLPSDTPGCCEPLLFEESFDGGLGAWILTGDNETYFWQASTSKFQSGVAALYFGSAANDDYGTFQDGTATSAQLDLPDLPGLSLDLWTWYDTEVNFDSLALSLVSDEGVETILDEFTGHDGDTWTEHTYDLTDFAGQTVSIRFTWHSDVSLTYAGVWVDSLAITQGCCQVDGDCEDGNPCTADSCPGDNSYCSNETIPGCCLNNLGCDDDDPCTLDFCSEAGGTCSHVDMCCDVDGDCDDGDDVCTDDLCINGYCEFLPSGAAGCCESETWFEGFEAGIDLWTITDPAGPDTTWKTTGVQSWEGGASLYFGNDAGDGYGLNEDADALSPIIDVPDAGALSYHLWYDTEDGYDNCDVLVVSGAGEETLLASYTGQDQQAWTEYSHDLSPWSGETIQIRLVMHSDYSLSYTGCFFDNLVVGQICCNGDSDCDDGNPCTDDSCPGEESLCINLWQPGCCNVTADCDDDDPCTEDQCTNKVCEHTDVCCTEDADCDDGDDLCTVDTCVDGYCMFAFSGAAGCCEEEPFADDFSGPGTDWSLDPMDNGVGWNIWTTPPEGTSSPVLYYGDPAAGDFNSGGINSGHARSPEIDLAVPLVGYQVSFDLYIDGESSPAYDRPTLSVSWSGPEGPWVDIWTKAEYDTDAMATWQPFSVDISGLAGHQVVFRWTFETIDSFTNTGLGAMVDDFVVSSPCLPLACQVDADCTDGVPGTTGVCDQGLCVFSISEDFCESAVDCNDEDICTEDSCLSGFCDHEIFPDCCYGPDDCDDENSCTEDSCDLDAFPGPQCANAWAEGCCVTDEDCDDGDQCTTDTCPGEGGQCTYPSIADCCLNDAACDDSDPCTVDLCMENQCQHEDLCCTEDEDCDDGDDLCTTDSCVEGYCVFAFTPGPGCCVPPLFKDDFSTLTGWTLDTNWEIGPTAIGEVPIYGNPDPEWDHSSNGDNSVLGVILGGQDPGDTVYGPFWATSPVVDISAAMEPHISGWRWLNSDYPPYNIDSLEVWDGLQWIALWVSPDVDVTIEDDAWVFVDYNVTVYKNADFRVRIGYEVGDTLAFAYSQWNLDDVQIYDAAALAGDEGLCCAGVSDCQGIYPAGAACVDGQCI